jgi:hypothetical protein
LRPDERSPVFPGGEAKLQCLRLDPQCHREPPERRSKKGCIQNSVSNLKRDDGISNPLEPPVGNKDEALRWSLECGKAVTELAWGPEIESYVAIRTGEKSVRFFQ